MRREWRGLVTTVAVNLKSIYGTQMVASFSAWLDFGYEARAAEAYTHFKGKQNCSFSQMNMIYFV